MSKLVIIGGVAAGMSAAAKARRLDPNLEIVVYAEGEYVSYGGCGLPYFIGGRIKTKEALVARSVEEFAQQGIQVKPLHKVLKIDTDLKIVLVENLQTKERFEQGYDRLVIATGARAIIPPFENLSLPGIFTLRNIPDSLAIKAYLQEFKPRKTLIVGGGYIGLEMVENLMSFGCEISIIEAAPQILPNMDPDIADKVTEYLTLRGIKVITSNQVKGFSGQERVEEVVTDSASYPADMVILSIGVIPNSELAAEAGIELGFKNAIRVNEKCETSVPNIWAAGDCATIRHLITGQDTYLALGTNANKQGKIAGTNAAGGNASIKGVLGTGIARVMDMEVSRTGLGERECQQAGIDYVSRIIKGRTAAAYCPISGDIWVKILATPGDLKILGAQIAGFAGAGKRIDALTTAITVGATVEDLLNMDLAYSPPFSPVWDPILIALEQFKTD